MRFLYAILIALLCAFILAPTTVIAITSFGGSEIMEFPPRDLTLRWYASAISKAECQSAAWNSLWIAFVTMLISTPLAIAGPLALVRGHIPGREVIQTMLLAPLVVPSIVVGLSILLASSRFDLPLVETRLLIAHVLITLPYLVRTITSSLMRLDPVAEEAARVLGANSIMTFLFITLPALRPGIIAGMIFAFIISIDNVSISLFLASAKTNTLPLSLMSYIEYNLDPSVAAVSTLLIIMALAAAIALERLAGLRHTLGG